MGKTTLTAVIPAFTGANDMLEAAKQHGEVWRVKRKAHTYLGWYSPLRRDDDMRGCELKTTLYYSLAWRHGVFSLVVGSSAVPLSAHRICRIRQAFGVPEHVPTETHDGGYFVRFCWHDAAAMRKAA